MRAIRQRIVIFVVDTVEKMKIVARYGNTHNPSSWELEAEGQKFNVILDFIMSSSSAETLIQTEKN